MALKEEDFDRFWEFYPRKVSKKTAQKAFLRLDNKLTERIMVSLGRHIEYWIAMKTEVQYIPHPTTWLNQERWNDELVIENKAIKKSIESNSDMEAICNAAKEIILSGVIGWKETN